MQQSFPVVCAEKHGHGEAPGWLPDERRRDGLFLPLVAFNIFSIFDDELRPTQQSHHSSPARSHVAQGRRQQPKQSRQD
jgi:hypothetical protein